MNKNIQEVLGRGEQLDSKLRDSITWQMMQRKGTNAILQISCEEMANASEQLSYQSKQYLKDSKHLNWQAIYQKYGPPAIVIFVVGLVFYLRMFWW